MMTDIETQALTYLLQGEHPVLAVLRDQLRALSVADREFTGVGFFTNFTVPESAVRLSPPGRMVIGDVHAEIDGLEHGAGFILFIENGAIKTLECFIHEAAWPR